jgi:hypothetical protein
MSTSDNTGHWMEDWWPAFLILFGVIFVTCLVNFYPQ